MIAARYEKRSVVVTTNLAFAEWPKVFGGDETLAVALLDRVSHHATVITTRGYAEAVDGNADLEGIADVERCRFREVLEVG